MNSKQLLKRSFSNIAYNSGALSLFARRLSRLGAIILMYHRVLDTDRMEEHDVQPGMYVSAKTFQRQMECLQKQFRILPLEELTQRLVHGKPIGGCCAVTFDDGWLDNYTNAFPILLRLRIPATIFLASGFIGTSKWFWPDEIIHYIRHFRRTDISLSRLGYEHLWQTAGDRNGGDQFNDNVIAILKTWEPDKRSRLLDRFREEIPEGPPGRILMNWQEAKAMWDSGYVSYGAHSSNHVILDQVDPVVAEHEIVQSRKEIEENVPSDISLFAYPNGNFNNELKTILTRHRFLGAFTTRKGWVEAKCPIMEIPRIGIHEDISNTLPLFLSRVSFTFY